MFVNIEVDKTKIGMWSLLCKNRAGLALIVASIPQRLGLPKKYIFLCLPAVQCACLFEVQE